MAGIGHSRGLLVRMVCGCQLCCDSVAACDVLVIATDTRSMTKDEAIAHTMVIAEAITGDNLLFKKTDSALRGHVVAELKTLMETTGYGRAVFMPANPSKGRIIRGGEYFINSVPLHKTAFGYDPEFPALTSSLRERFPDAEAAGIIIPDAETEEDIDNIVAHYNDGRTLFAGGADLFKSLTQNKHAGTEPPHAGTECAPTGLLGQCEDLLGAWPKTATKCTESPYVLILCGSTQSKPQTLGFPKSGMPLTVYDGSDDLELWLADALSKYMAEGSLMLTIPHTHHTGRDVAIHLRTMMAKMARDIVGHRPPHHIIIEGGATAWATLQALGWSQFEIMRQWAPGVVSMQADNGTIVTLKPGSYPWNNKNEK